MWELPALGAIAASSIYLGMPLGRSRRLSPLARTALTGVTVGILAYVALDILGAGLGELGVGSAGGLPASRSSLALFVAGITGGVLLIPILSWRTRRARRAEPPFSSGSRPPSAGVGATFGTTGGLELSTLTALGIGTHNLAEGFALGTAYATGIASATVLLAGAIILHKSAEGYCICGCAPTSSSQYSLTRLASLGLLAGGPAFLGTILGGAIGLDPSLSATLYGTGVGVVASVIGLIARSPPGRNAGRPMTGFAVAAFSVVTLLTFLITGAGP